MIAIVDYGAGNLHSVRKAVEVVGGRAVVTADESLLAEAEKVILPGVGAFGDGMAGLAACGLAGALASIAAAGTPFLGICLGMQLLFEESEEGGMHRGLELLPGRVAAFRQPELIIPHIGWNQLLPERECPLLEGVPAGEYVYFNHSYICEPASTAHRVAVTDYGRRFASVVWDGCRLFGVQFHPEKSQKAGLQILKNFVEL